MCVRNYSIDLGDFRPIYSDLDLNDFPFMKRCYYINQVSSLNYPVYSYYNKYHNRANHMNHAAYIFENFVSSLSFSDQLSPNIVEMCKFTLNVHDLGHMILSHRGEKLLNNIGVDFKHEKQTIKIVREALDVKGINKDVACLLIDGKFDKVIKDYNIRNKYDKFILSLISNPDIDFDRISYLKLDSKYLGGINFSYNLDDLQEEVVENINKVFFSPKFVKYIQDSRTRAHLIYNSLRPTNIMNINKLLEFGNLLKFMYYDDRMLYNKKIYVEHDSITIDN